MMILLNVRTVRANKSSDSAILLRFYDSNTSKYCDSTTIFYDPIKKCAKQRLNISKMTHFYLYATILYNSVSNLSCACKAPGCFRTLTDRHGPPRIKKNRFFFGKIPLKRPFSGKYSGFFARFSQLAEMSGHTSQKWPNTSKYWDSTKILYDPIQKMCQKLWGKMTQYIQNGPFLFIYCNSVSNLTCARRAPDVSGPSRLATDPHRIEKNRFLSEKAFKMAVFRKARWIFRQNFTNCGNFRPYIQKMTKNDPMHLITVILLRFSTVYDKKCVKKCDKKWCNTSKMAHFIGILRFRE